MGLQFRTPGSLNMDMQAHALSKRISAQMVVCMCIASHLKEYDVNRASHGDIFMTWVVVYDTSDISIEGI